MPVRMPVRRAAAAPPDDGPTTVGRAGLLLASAQRQHKPFNSSRGGIPELTEASARVPLDGTMTVLSTLKICAADVVVSAVWVFASAFIPEISPKVVEATGWSDLNVVLVLIVSGLVLIGPLCEALGGACFNPAVSTSFAACGKWRALTTIPRIASQAAGGVAGGYGAIFLRGESSLVELSVGLRPGISLTEGAVCEFILSFLSCIVIISSLSLKSKIAISVAQLGATVLLILGGLNYTGPSMNPAVSFCWFWHFEGHTPWEHALVFWLAPIAGSILAGLLAMESKPKTAIGRRKVKSN